MSYTQKFDEYFKRPAALKAAHSLKKGAKILLTIEGESENIEDFTFCKEDGTNTVQPGVVGDAELGFSMTPAAADAILDLQSDEVGEIGVHIAKLVVSSDPHKKVKIRLHTGFVTLFSKGYFGVVKSGGAGFASFLASRGLGGMGAMKAVIKKMRG